MWTNAHRASCFPNHCQSCQKNKIDKKISDKFCSKCHLKKETTNNNNNHTTTVRRKRKKTDRFKPPDNKQPTKQPHIPIAVTRKADAPLPTSNYDEILGGVVIKINLCGTQLPHKIPDPNNIHGTDCRLFFRSPDNNNTNPIKEHICAAVQQVFDDYLGEGIVTINHSGGDGSGKDDGMFVCAPPFQQTTTQSHSSHYHRDTPTLRFRKLTVLVPIDVDGFTGGIEVRYDTQRYGSSKSKRQLEQPDDFVTEPRYIKQEVTRASSYMSENIDLHIGEALVFDSRLLHRSLLHRSNDRGRVVYAFTLLINSSQTLETVGPNTNPKVQWVQPQMKVFGTIPDPPRKLRSSKNKNNNGVRVLYPFHSQKSNEA